MRKRFSETTPGRAVASLRSRSASARRLIVGGVMSMAVRAAWAGGGLQAGTSAVNNFTTWFYGIAGVLAGAYLLWVGVQCWSNKADWVHDFGGGIAKVAGVGSALVLAGWAFGLFA